MDFGIVELHRVASCRLSVRTDLISDVLQSSVLRAATADVYLATDHPLHLRTDLQLGGGKVGAAFYWLAPQADHVGTQCNASASC